MHPKVRGIGGRHHQLYYRPKQPAPETDIDVYFAFSEVSLVQHSPQTNAYPSKD